MGKRFIVPSLVLLLMLGCAGQSPGDKVSADINADVSITTADFQYLSEQFADLYVARYKVPGFDDLSLKQRELLYYLYEAALSGRDIYYDQNYKHNLLIRHTLDGIITGYTGDTNSSDYAAFMVYAKRFWFSNGIHHHYSTAKLSPGFSAGYFSELLIHTPAENLPLAADQSPADLATFLTPILFDPDIAARKVNLNPDEDKLTTSATNLYVDVTEAEVEAFYAARIDNDDPTPISWGLNSQLVKVDGELVERVYRIGGLYSEALEQVVHWLEKAVAVAENDQQQKALRLLADHLRTGDLKTFDEYNIAWVNDTDSRIDVVNGFIEVYADPLAYRGAFESVVSFKDLEATKRIAAIGDEAQWFEDNSPLMEAHKRANVKGISAKVITVVVESGDSSPSTPIGINLPNANWIRANHGSKSVSLGNITDAYSAVSSGSGKLEEFIANEEQLKRARQWGMLAGNLHTDMHEVIGHASGTINPGVGTPKQTLKSYSSTLEEARADLVAMYYLMDPKLIEIGVMPSLEVGKVGYDLMILNGLVMQLIRIKPGDNIEQAHMRNRQMNAAWAFELGQADNVIEKIKRDGKTFYVINDYEKLREIFGTMLREIQRIKSEGDYEAGRNLVETYGVQIDRELHAEVLERNARLNLAAYGGFINPRLVPTYEGGKLVDVTVEFPADFATQMLEYGKKYSFLPVR